MAETFFISMLALFAEIIILESILPIFIWIVTLVIAYNIGKYGGKLTKLVTKYSDKREKEDEKRTAWPYRSL